MNKLDIKDRKILYELDKNCRQSNTQIGKKVGLKKDVVSYRINKLQEENIITNFWTLIDTFKLGYNVFRIYITFQYVNPKIKTDIIQHFVDYKDSWVVNTDKGEIDLAIVVWVKNIFDFYQFWNKTLDKYEEYFEKYWISIYIQGIAYEKTFLLGTDYENAERVLGKPINCGVKPVKIDEIDYKILNELAMNARVPLIELSEKLKCSSQTINYRIKNLVKSGVIMSFRVNLNLQLLGLQHYKVDIYLREHKLKKPIIDFLKSKPYVEYLNFAMGWADIEPEFVVKNMEELLKIIENIDTKFPNSIKKQNFWVIEKVHKLRCIPEIF